ncbi:MAG TPA: FHA domain-containing protein [Ktedonobacterales bacterium]|nr:FHA domain-containing protein [Ktedonobacterales bacterium]
MTACSHCGREAAPNNLYCQFCGQKLDAQPAFGQSASYIPEGESAEYANGGVYFAAGPWVPSMGESAHNEAPATSMSPEPAQVATVVSRARLVVRSISSAEGQPGSDEREFILDEHDVAVGRSPSCDIPLSGDQLASRRHALIRFKNGHYTVVDLGSSNGTYLNDHEVREETPLQDGDFIKIGGHEIQFSTAPASPHASLAGARMSMPLPATPLAETNPNVHAIDFAGLAQAVPASEADVAPDAAQLSQEEAGEPSPDLLEAPSDAVAPGAEPDSEALAGADDVEEAAPHEAGAVNFVMTEPSGAPASLPAEDTIDALRTQLNEVSAALTERAAHAAATAARSRAALSEVRAQLTSALAASPSAPDDASTSDLSELVAVARQAAEHPRHLDYVTTLAARASEIADALEARPASEPDATLRATIEGLLARIDELLA